MITSQSSHRCNVILYFDLGNDWTMDDGSLKVYKYDIDVYQYTIAWKGDKVMGCDGNILQKLLNNLQISIIFNDTTKFGR